MLNTKRLDERALSIRYSAPTDGFRLAYERVGAGEPAVLVHGSPGDGMEYSKVVPLIRDHADVVVPDLRGFGLSDKLTETNAKEYSRTGQVKAVIALMDELQLKKAVLVGYDIGGFTVQSIARARPDLVKALVIAPPIPGVGRRMLEVAPVNAFWHATLFRTPLVEKVFDSNRPAIRELLAFQLMHWAGPKSTVKDELLDHMVETYSAPGAFAAGISWFRHDEGNPISAYAAEPPADPTQRFDKPVSILWPRHDPLFPTTWSNDLDHYFSDFTLDFLENSGHYAPVEAPEAFAEKIIKHLRAK